ncbi:PAS domain S-box protein [Pseudodesulfovibrio sp. JC047]|uniref:PAS domain-containing sensor histidine kinase n=1 Tax=Pseudodesulfovibrio sp. JC047 TaxID=2683199 RepID=UPI0013D84DE4|nr:PAS domain S-box protein [Pseudodesulfovibrio sp. JC047]NDV19696.1 PAS domain S-box protein [Pseudodesulfovibrio sp. JC047]
METVSTAARQQAIIEEQRQRIRELESELDKFQGVMDSMSDGLLILQDTFFECNQSACRIWKADKGEILGRSPAEFAPEKQPNGRNSRLMAQEKIRAAAEGTPQRFFWKDKRGDGSLIDTEVTLKAMVINDEEYVVATIRDITDDLRKERKRATLFDRMECIIEKRTEELRSSHDALKDERSYRTRVEEDLERADMELSQVFETSMDGLIVTDNKKNILKINRAFSELSGFGHDDIQSKKCYEIFPCQGCDGVHCMASHRLMGRDLADYETECRAASGQLIPCSLTATKLKDSDGVPLGMVVSYRNITDYRQWVEALQHSEALHRITLASISDAVFITDDDGHFIYISPSVKSVFGYTEHEVRWFDTIFALLGDDFYDRERLASFGEIRNIEVSVCDKLERQHELMVNVKKVSIQSGTTLITCRDITEKREAEREASLKQEQLVQAGKMVSLGILVSGVAHEVNNPNNYIMLNSQLLARMWAGAIPALDRYYADNGDFTLGGLKYSQARDRVPRLFDSVLEGSERIKRIVKDLKDYARHDSTEMDQGVFLNSVLKHSLNLLANQIKQATSHFEVEYDHGRPMVRGNYQKIEQVIINLVQNACESLPEKRCAMSVKTRLDAETGTAVVEVVDEGVGISKNDLPHVTDPFFTTKRDIGGTGLGLSVSHKIVSEHGGTLEFFQRTGNGTRAMLILPAEPHSK